MKRYVVVAVEAILSIIGETLVYLLNPGPRVFVNFRGKELRNGFVSHVVKALKDERMNVFIDSLEHRGVNDTLESLLERIDNSKLALAIFSDGYTESDWCLDELERMNDRMKERKLVVIPIFYMVSTDDVKNFQGKFGENFRKMLSSRDLTYDSNKAKDWRYAVRSIASKTGLTSQVHSIDSDLVEAIAWESMEKLGHIPSRSLGGQVLVEFCAALAVYMFSTQFTGMKFMGSIEWFLALVYLFVARKTLGWLMRWQR